MQTRNAASVLPDPVGAAISVCRPAAISRQPPACGSVGPAGNRRSNQARTAGWNESSTRSPYPRPPTFRPAYSARRVLRLRGHTAIMLHTACMGHGVRTSGVVALPGGIGYDLPREGDGSNRYRARDAIGRGFRDVRDIRLRADRLRGWAGPGGTPAAAPLARLAAPAFVLAVPAVLQLRGRWALLRRQAPRVVVYGLVAVAGGQLFYFNAIESIPIGIALLLEYLGVVLVVGWLWVSRGER